MQQDAKVILFAKPIMLLVGEENQVSQVQSSQDSIPPGQKRPRFDPKELAKKRAKEAKDEAKRMTMAKEASTMRSISSFFAKPAK